MAQPDHHLEEQGMESKYHRKLQPFSHELQGNDWQSSPPDGARGVIQELQYLLSGPEGTPEDDELHEDK